MKRLLSSLFLLLAASQVLQAQKTWIDDGVTITKLDTLMEGYESLRGFFIIENTSIYEVMNRILDVDAYDWVEAESTSKMLLVDPADSSFTFDFFVNIPILFIKKTGRVKVQVTYRDGVFYTRSTQIKDYDRDEDYDLVDYYSAQWKLQPRGDDVQVTYLGVYQDQKMLININWIIINRIRKRLNGTFHNLRDLTSEKESPARVLYWPKTNQGQVMEAGKKE